MKKKLSEFLWYNLGKNLWIYFAKHHDYNEVKQVWDWYSLEYIIKKE